MLEVESCCSGSLVNVHMPTHNHASHHSQGRMMKRAFGKLKLEHVVIGKGQFEQDRAKPSALDVIPPTHPNLVL
jgi:hypothetical protein